MTLIEHAEISTERGRIPVLRRSGSPDDDNVILLLHPANLQAKVWRAVIDRLPADFTVIAPELRWHGGFLSPEPPQLSVWEADTLALIASVAPKRLHLVGGSVGAAIAVTAAAERRDIAATVTTLGGAFLPLDSDPMPAELPSAVDVAREFAVAALPEDADPALVRSAAEMIADKPARLMYEILRASFATDVRPKLDDLRASIVVAVGSEDRSCPPDESQWFADAARGEFRLLDGIGHLAMIEVPDVVAAMISTHVLQRTETTPEDTQ